MALASRRSTRALCDVVSRTTFGRRFLPVAVADPIAKVSSIRGVSSSACIYASIDKKTELAMIKDLREKTGAPLMDVKKALNTAEFDLDKAYGELRKRGLAAASKKAGRVAAEGLIGVRVSECGQRAGIVEVNAETDFVSRNEQFLQLVADAAQAVTEARAAVGQAVTKARAAVAAVAT